MMDRYDAKGLGHMWMDRVIVEEGTEGWRELSYPAFCQAVANANSPGFPHVPDEYLDDAIMAAWDYLVGSVLGERLANTRPPF